MHMMFSKLPTMIIYSGIFVGEEKIVFVTVVQYLGVILDSTSSFKKHIKTNDA